MTNETKSALKSSTIIAIVILVAMGVAQNSGIALDEKLLPPDLQQIIPAIIVLLSALVGVVGRVLANKKIDRLL